MQSYNNLGIFLGCARKLLIGHLQLDSLWFQTKIDMPLWKSIAYRNERNKDRPRSMSMPFHSCVWPVCICKHLREQCRTAVTLSTKMSNIFWSFIFLIVFDIQNLTMENTVMVQFWDISWHFPFVRWFADVTCKKSIKQTFGVAKKKSEHTAKGKLRKSIRKENNIIQRWK